MHIFYVSTYTFRSENNAAILLLPSLLGENAECLAIFNKVHRCIILSHDYNCVNYLFQPLAAPADLTC